MLGYDFEPLFTLLADSLMVLITEEHRLPCRPVEPGKSSVRVA
jgi:hypothetical protein